MWLLLIKQDKLTLLEQELLRTDQAEDAELFLGSVRRDKNAQRKEVLGRLEAALKDYGEPQLFNLIKLVIAL